MNNFKRTEPITAKWNNTVLENFTLMSSEEFACQTRFVHFSWTKTGYFQFNHPEAPYIGAWKLFYYNTPNEKPEGYAIGTSYADKKVYFAHFGCDHEYRELSMNECRARKISHLGMCWHVVECKHCGRIESYDSSG